MIGVALNRICVRKFGLRWTGRNRWCYDGDRLGQILLGWEGTSISLKFWFFRNMIFLLQILHCWNRRKGWMKIQFHHPFILTVSAVNRFPPPPIPSQPGWLIESHTSYFNISSSFARFKFNFWRGTSLWSFRAQNTIHEIHVPSSKRNK